MRCLECHACTFYVGDLWDYCGPAEACGDNSTQMLTNWNEYLDPFAPGSCAEYKGGLCEAFVPIGSRVFVPGNVNITDLDSRANRFVLSTGSFSFLPTSCRYPCHTPYDMMVRLLQVSFFLTSAHFLLTFFKQGRIGKFLV
jgi:hypothetical protein